MIDLATIDPLPLGKLILSKIIQLALVLVGAHVVIRMANKILSKLFNTTEFDPTLERFTHKTIIAILWMITFGIFLIILGVDVNAIVTSFGVGTFIVGFALKDTLNNFAAGVMILLNKPFKIGDDVEVKKIRGIVKTISMSNTKLIMEDNVKVTIPNSIVWGNPIQNYTAYKGVKTKKN